MSSYIVGGVLVLTLLGVAFGPYVLGLVAYSVEYSAGVRVGQVLKLSQKGLIWKTWEGGLGVTQSGAYSEYWNFSIDSRQDTKDALLQTLQRAYESGNLVKMHYVQHVGIRPWIGKTSFIVDRIEFTRGEQ